MTKLFTEKGFILNNITLKLFKLISIFLSIDRTSTLLFWHILLKKSSKIKIAMARIINLNDFIFYDIESTKKWLIENGIFLS